MKKRLILAATIAAISTNTYAHTVGDITVPESIIAHEQSLQFNGAGIRSKFFMDLYVGSLFTSAQTELAAPIINGEIPAAIRLNITSGMITAEKLTDALNDGFNNATNGDTSAIDNSIERFVAATFAEAISEGDQFTLVSVPGEGVYSYKNDQQLTFIKDEAFRQALMAIWLGDKPTDKQLKKEMLKG
ncbi:MAG TPA: chalcone isomerase [Vibrio sp.]|nr:chalcone isomerase [Vibrio sp.]